MKEREPGAGHAGAGIVIKEEEPNPDIIERLESLGNIPLPEEENENEDVLNQSLPSVQELMTRNRQSLLKEVKKKKIRKLKRNEARRLSVNLEEAKSNSPEPVQENLSTW